MASCQRSRMMTLKIITASAIGTLDRRRNYHVPLGLWEHLAAQWSLAALWPNNWCYADCCMPIVLDELWKPPGFYSA